MNDYEYELIGESIWDTYSDIAYLLAEKSALPRVVTTKGKDSPYDDEKEVDVDGGWTDDPDEVEDFKSRRKHFAKHLKNIRKGKAEPKQKTTDDPEFARDSRSALEPPDRPGPGGTGEGNWDPTHAQAAARLKSDLLSSRGREAEEHRQEAEKRVSAREKQAARSRTRAKK